MTQNINGLSKKQAEFLSHLAAEGKNLFSIQQAHAYWGSPAYTANVLSRLVQKGWLRRLERGVYMLLPLAAGRERVWSESGYPTSLDKCVIAAHLIQPAAVAYWSALHYWNMTEHIPGVVFVQSTRRKRPLEVLGMRFRFVSVKEAHFFGVIQRTVDGKPIYVTNREKTLLDAAARPDLSGGIAQLAQALQAAHSDINWQRLDDYLVRWGGGVVVKRLGYLLERLALPIPDRKTRLEQWQNMLSAGISTLEPGMAARGRTVTRWRVRVNVDVEQFKR
ncbi:MAG: type IV toxin-antitoxin system AbiEi family antitoxin domain-containing protein [Ardenticatenaceae bacterium]